MTTTLLVRRLKRVSKEMRTLGETMDYYGGFGKMGDRGREMIGAARLVKSWIKHIERRFRGRYWPDRPIRQTLNRRGHRLARLLAANRILK